METEEKVGKIGRMVAVLNGVNEILQYIVHFSVDLERTRYWTYPQFFLAIISFVKLRIGA